MDDTDWSADDALLARILKGYWIVKHQKNGTPNYFVLSKNAHGFTFEQVAYDSIVFNQVDFDNIESIAKKLTNRACGSFNSPGIMISLEFDGYKDIDDPAIQPADAMLSALRNAK